ncbi:3-oxoacyl-[acyl-carrier-protein] reductase isoform X2 [Phacochoerus africanus]|uniref:3-oxoacyl-[acyl-carrier-protein] reductase isoform X2 n=1 Tax=Phacochoerus africanus TaxID=41426 RepID=UPI001FD95C4D|nr:3-oxoacyl-[acyl-carrier-protein] reductase isoform X2 [Phacochoerus africanus]
MDRVCAVFGGSRGIGRAVARLMAQRGYRLAIVARNLQGARAVAGDLGGDHLALSCDVAKEQDVQSTFEEIEKNLGPVNFLVNAAGINRDNLLVRTSTEDMLCQLQTNLLGSMLTCKAAVKTMIKQQGGSIVNIGSVVGLKGNPGQSVYSASKGGLVGFSRALAKEVAKKKIRVNVVAPERTKCLSLDLLVPQRATQCSCKNFNTKENLKEKIFTQTQEEEVSFDKSLWRSRF